MRINTRLFATLLACAITTSASAALALPAFPGAEGFGAVATGGRGGSVIKVTHLGSSGPGSLQWALAQSGPRIIVFDVSGVIEGDLTISHGDVTIAGETAPGGGITIAGRLYAEYDTSVQNMIVRFLRIRPPPMTGGSGGDQYDAIQFSRNSRFILDHISVAWGSDETVDLYEADDVTVQWCTIEESSTYGHSEGEHNYGLINGPDGHRISLHHNLFAHHRNRCPAIANGPADIRNNVIYDAQNAFVHHNPASGEFNLVGNYFREGPSAGLIPFFFDDEDPGSDDPTYYLHGNYIDDPGDYVGMVDDPWASDVHPSFDSMRGDGHASGSEFDFAVELPGYMAITTEPAQEAYESVRAYAGAFPRDAITTRTLQEVDARSGSWGAHPPADLMAGLAPQSPPPDGDADGMPDAWESAHGLNPADGVDAVVVTATGYTAIKDYLHARARVVLGLEPEAPPGTGGGGSGGAPGAGGGAAGSEGSAAQGGSGGTITGQGGGSGQTSGANEGDDPSIGKGDEPAAAEQNGEAYWQDDAEGWTCGVSGPVDPRGFAAVLLTGLVLVATRRRNV